MAGSNTRASKKGCLASDLPMATETLLQIVQSVCSLLETPFTISLGKFQASSRLRHLAWQESVANVSLKAWQHSPPAGWIILWAEVPPKRPYDPVYDSDAALLQLSADFQCCNFGWIGSRLGRNWGRLVEDSNLQVAKRVQEEWMRPKAGSETSHVSWSVRIFSCWNLQHFGKKPGATLGGLLQRVVYSCIHRDCLQCAFDSKVFRHFDAKKVTCYLLVTWIQTQFDFTSDIPRSTSMHRIHRCSLDLPADEPGHMGQREPQVKSCQGAVGHPFQRHHWIELQ